MNRFARDSYSEVMNPEIRAGYSNLVVLLLLRFVASDATDAAPSISCTAQ